MRRLWELLMEATGVTCYVADDPLSCATASRSRRES
jgi:actin-like ATPase involved in cell morphogenesis